MSTRVRQALQGAAGAAGGDALNVEDVFSTYLYTGTNTTNTINNGIDLDGESGIIWIKNRDQSDNHYIFGGESGNDWTKILTPNATGYYGGATNIFDGVSSTGFTVKSDFGGVNTNNEDYVSWTFRKAPKFFDVVTYTGNGVAGRTISHNLGSTPGMIIVKRTDSSEDWTIYHRGLPSADYIRLTSAAKQTGGARYRFGDNSTAIAPTSTQFTVASYGAVNASGGTYVAYLFAHNDGDGEFGPTGDQDIIKCGSFTVNSSGWSVDLGFEPQWVMIKKASGTSDWGIVDNMRSWDTLSGTGDNATQLRANLSNAENRETYPRITSTGFNHEGAAGWLSSGAEYIYIAIRRGPMAVPESATDVFGVKDRYSEGSLPTWQSGFVTDMAMRKRTNGSDSYIYTRLTQGRELAANATSIEATTGNSSFDYMTGWGDIASTSSGDFGWNWRRAPNFFDVVAYSGNSTSGHTIDHNLGVAPEMIWIKSRTNTTFWPVYHKDVGYSSVLRLDSTSSPITVGMVTNTSATDFTLSTSAAVNSSGHTFIAYLFASLDGISKVGSYTGNGTSQTIDCGFSSGARFVLIKRATSAGAGWYMFDTERGIVAGNDALLQLNFTNAEWNGSDLIDPDNSGFQVTGDTNGVNDNGDTFIFYAIA